MNISACLNILVRHLIKSKGTGQLELLHLVQTRLASLRKELQSYFPDLSELEVKLIRNPFIVHLLPHNMQKECIELVNKSGAKDAFEILSLMKFCSKLSKVYNDVAHVPQYAHV